MSKVALLLLALSVCCTGCGPDDTVMPTEAQARAITGLVKGRFAHLAAARQAGDVAGFMSYCTDGEDLAFVAGGNVAKGQAAARQFVEDWLGSEEDGPELSVAAGKTTVLTPNAAIHSARMGSGMWTTAWRRRGGDWLLVHSAWPESVGGM